jgi:hypothetical protein
MTNPVTGEESTAEPELGRKTPWHEGGKGAKEKPGAPACRLPARGLPFGEG